MRLSRDGLCVDRGNKAAEGFPALLIVFIHARILQHAGKDPAGLLQENLQRIFGGKTVAGLQFAGPHSMLFQLAGQRLALRQRNRQIRQFLSSTFLASTHKLS